MKKRIQIDVIFFISLIAFFVFTGGHSEAGENQLIHPGPEGKTVLLIVAYPSANKTLYSETQLELLKRVDTGINWSMMDNGLLYTSILAAVIDPVNRNIHYCCARVTF